MHGCTCPYDKQSCTIAIKISKIEHPSLVHLFHTAYLRATRVRACADWLNHVAHAESATSGFKGRVTTVSNAFSPFDRRFSLSLSLSTLSSRRVVSSSRDSQGWLQEAGTRSGRGRNVREFPRAARPQGRK